MLREEDRRESLFTWKTVRSISRILLHCLKQDRFWAENALDLSFRILKQPISTSPLICSGRNSCLERKGIPDMKTIFVIVDSGAAIRNILRTNVLAVLKPRPDTRLV